MFDVENELDQLTKVVDIELKLDLFFKSLKSTLKLDSKTLQEIITSFFTRGVENGIQMFRSEQERSRVLENTNIDFK